MTPKPLQFNLWKSGKSKCDSCRPHITNLQSLKTATNVLVSDTTGHFQGSCGLCLNCSVILAAREGSSVYKARGFNVMADWRMSQLYVGKHHL